MTTYTIKCLPCGRCGERWAILDAMGHACGIYRHIIDAEARRLQLMRS